MPLFSIITINLNNAIGLQKTIESVVMQTFFDFEYMIIDGASTDNSLDVIKNHTSKISSWISEKDLGIYSAMNKGIVKAKGTYLLFLNSGDWFFNENVLAKVASSQPIEDILYGDVLYNYAQSVQRYKKQPSYISKKHLLCGTILHPASFIKKTLFESLGFYNEDYKITADYDFVLKALLQHKASYRYLNTPIALHNFDGISADETNLANINRERLNIQQNYFSANEIDKTTGYLAERNKLPFRIYNFIENKLMIWKYGTK